MMLSVVILTALYSAMLVTARPSGQSHELVARTSSTCAKDEFWWAESTSSSLKSNPQSLTHLITLCPAAFCCLKSGGPTKPDQCPGDRSCPPDWYWVSTYSSCVPKNPPTTTSPTCTDKTFTWWDDVHQCCSTPPTTPTPTTPTPRCDDNYFFYPLSTLHPTLLTHLIHNISFFRGLLSPRRRPRDAWSMPQR